MTETASTRTSRSRRVVALMGWACLVGTAFLLWNVRQMGSVRSVTIEPVAFLLAAFAAFVGVFSWMLYNPGRRSAAESPSLFFGAGATLFPPPIIGFCLMPIDSELRWWLALGLFLLCAIAILSHLPDEFFGVPRSRQTYLTPLPAFDRVDDTVLDPESSWFRFEDLSGVVADTERPSLAPRAYLQREILRSPTTARAEVRAATAVDDILGSDFELGLLDDVLPEDELLGQRRPARASAPSSLLRSPHPNRQFTEGQRSVSALDSSVRTAADSEPAADLSPRPFSAGRPPIPPSGGVAGQAFYQAFNPESRYLINHQKQRRQSARQLSSRRAVNRQDGPAQALEVTQQESSVARTTGRVPNADQTAEPQSSATGSTSARSISSRSSTPTAPRVGSGSRNVSTARKANEGSRSLPIAENRSPTPATSSPGSSVSRTAHGAHSVATTAPRARGSVAQNQTPTPRSVAENVPAAEGTRQLFGQTLPQPREIQNRPPARDVGRADSDVAALERDTSGRRSRYDTPAPASTVVDSTGLERELSGTASGTTAVQDRTAVADATSAFQRTKEANGTELVEGVMPVHFDRGQKRVNVHVPFSPPLAGVPDVECESVDGEELRLKVAVRQSYGIRIEARRSIADQPLDTEIGFAAIYVSGS